MTQPPNEIMLAELIPGLEAADLISIGGQKAVYKAQLGGRAVALKLIGLQPEGLLDEDVNEDSDEENVIEVNVPLERARREFEILSQVDVPVLARRGPVDLNIAEVDGKFWLYFTEEWIDGRTLRSMIQEGNLSPEQIVRLGNDLIEAVCWLAERELVHRDIKPANVMFEVERSGYVLIDPGLALDLQAPSLTQANATVGTIHYLSPEQIDPSRKRALDFRSDLFAIGVVLYEAATGEHPFAHRRASLSEVLFGIHHTNPAPVTDKIEGFPPELSKFISD